MTPGLEWHSRRSVGVRSQRKGFKGRIALPKVATNVGKNEAVKFDLRIYTGDDCADLTKIFVDSYGLDAPVLLGEVRHTSDEWSNVELYLPSNLTNRTWVQPILDVNFQQSRSVVHPRQVHAVCSRRLFG